MAGRAVSAISWSLVVLAASVAGDRAGLCPAPLATAGALVLGATAVASAARVGGAPRWTPIAWCVVAFALAPLVGRGELGGTGRLLVLATSTAAVAALVRGPGALARVAAVFLAAAVLRAAEDHAPWFSTLDGATRRLASCAVFVGGRSPSMGPSYVPALPGVVAAVVLAVHAREGGSVRRFLAGAGAIALTYVAYVNFWAAVPEPESQYPVRTLFPTILTLAQMGRMAALLFPPTALAVAIAVVVAVATFERRRTPDGRVDGGQFPPPTRAASAARRLALIGAVPVVGFALWSVRPAPPTSGNAKPVVLLYEPGFSNWLKPDWESFGAYGVGMLGMLPDYLERIDIAPRMVSKLSAADLASARAVVFVNYEGGLSRDEAARLKEFVRGGGRMFVVGDHSFVRDGRNPLDDLLADTGIRFGCNTGNFFVGGWLHSYAVLDTTIGRGERDAYNELGIVTGAALDVAGSAFPVVVGRYGYADDGDPVAKSKAFLGDMAYSHGEPLGDVVLVAGEFVGAGRVLVMADTTSVGNALLPHAHGFVNSCFTWLLADDGGGPVRGAGPAIAFAAALAASLLLQATSGGRTAAAATALAAAVGLAVLAVPVPAVRRPYVGRVAVIDVGHIPDVPYDCGMGDGLGSLERNLFRNGYFPLESRDAVPSETPATSVWALVAPRRAVDADEVRALVDYVRRGGLLLACGGRADRDALRPLLDELGADVAPKALGPVAVDALSGIRSIAFKDAYAVENVCTQNEVLLTAGADKLAVRRRFGRGTVVFVSDRRFFGNANLETGASYLVGNVIFLKRIVEEHRRHAEQ